MSDLNQMQDKQKLGSNLANITDLQKKLSKPQTSVKSKVAK